MPASAELESGPFTASPIGATNTLPNFTCICRDFKGKRYDVKDNLLDCLYYTLFP